MKTIRVLLVSAAVAATTLCIAGSSWRYKCDTSSCGFEGDLGVGGGFVFHKVSGYCTTCRKFVSISWKVQGLTGEMKKFQDQATDLLEEAPDKMGNVWNPSTGRTAHLYGCPHCKEPFMEIDNHSLQKARHSEFDGLLCPGCTNRTLRFRYRGQYD